MKKIKAVIFDLDGTVGDTIPLCLKAFRQAIEPLAGHRLSDTDIIATFGPSEEGTIMALAPDSYDKAFADFLACYEAFHDMCPAPFAGIEDILNMLNSKGVRIAMVTGKGKFSTDITLRRFGLSDRFEIVETGVVSGPVKPEGIRNVLDRFPDIEQDEVVYVGDSFHDIIASREAGVPVVSVAWASSADPQELAEHSPDALVHTIADLSQWLEERT